MSVRHPNARYNLIELPFNPARESNVTRLENKDWHDVFTYITDVFRIRGVKPMYALEAYVYDLQGNNILPPAEWYRDLFGMWLQQL